MSETNLICTILTLVCLHYTSWALFVHINWTLTASRNLAKERLYLNPAYEDVAISSCDMTDICDVNCCNDKDCSVEQIKTFHCVDINYGEDKQVVISQNLCKNHAYFSYTFELFPFLCCTINNTSYLGEYFSNRKMIKSIHSFKQTLETHSNFNTNSLSVYTKHCTSNNAVGYRFGLPLKIKNKLNDDQFSESATETLLVPGSLLQPNGVWCADMPVYFLKDRESHCIQLISEEKCRNNFNSPLNAIRYLISDTYFNSSSLEYKFPFLLSDYLGLNTSLTEIKFLCFGNGSRYVTFSFSAFQKIALSSNSLNMIFEECMNNISDKMTIVFNNVTNECENVLVSAAYTFVWNASKLASANIIYGITNVPLTSNAYLTSGDLTFKSNKNKNNVLRHKERRSSIIKKKLNFYVTQHFSVKFIHISHSQTENMTLVELKEKQKLFSGNPGYNIGSPIFAAGSTLHQEKERSTWSDKLKESVVVSWRLGAQCSETQPISFGYNSISTCHIVFQQEDFNNCSALRLKVKKMHEKILPGEWIARNGTGLHGVNASNWNASMVPILRCENGSVTPHDRENECDAIPFMSDISFLYTSATTLSGDDVHHIIGASLRVELIRWKLTDGKGQQRFALVSSVTFTPVPLKDPPVLSRWWSAQLARENSAGSWFYVFDIPHPLAVAATGLALFAAVLYPRRQPLF